MRHRGPRILIGILIAVVVLAGLGIGGWLIAESTVRQAATERIREAVATAFGVPVERVTAEVGDGAVIPQLLAGSLDRVDLTIEDVGLAGVTGSATAVAEGVPTAEGGAIARLTAEVTLPSASVGELVATATGLPAESITVGSDTISFATELSVVLATVPLGVDLSPSAVDGAIVLDPVSVTVAGNRISVADLRANPLVGAAAGPLLAPRVVCVADTLPASLALEGLRLRGGELRVVLRGVDVPTDGAALARTGAC